MFDCSDGKVIETQLTAMTKVCSPVWQRDNWISVLCFVAASGADQGWGRIVVLGKIRPRVTLIFGNEISGTC